MRSVLRPLFIAALLVPLAAWAAVLPGPIPARVLAVLDGDTLRVRARIWLGQEVETLVRLAGIDAPERDAPCTAARALAQRAHHRLRDLAGTEIALFDLTQDKYGGRVAARIVNATGADIASILLAEGLARPYGGGARPDWCRLLLPASVK